MKTQKVSRNKSIETSLYYYGVATAEYDVFDNDIQDTVNSYFHNNNERMDTDTYRAKANRVVSKENTALKKNIFSLVYMWKQMMSLAMRVAVFLTRIPVPVLWFILLSFMSLYLGMSTINTIHGGFGHMSSEKVYNGITTVMINPLSSHEGSQNQESFDTSLLQELSMDSYVLQSGDTLLALAIEFGRNVDTLVSVNAIQDATSIQIGQKIFVPTQDGIIHKIKRNETLGSIAKTYNVNENAIVDINNLQNETLTIGKQLFIPDAKMNWFDLGLVLGTVFQLPTRGRLTSGYGYRVSPITGRRHFHGAIDIANKIGTPIVAAATGVVSAAGTNVVYGKHIEIAHPNGYKTLYTHLHNMKVRRGQRVSRGAVIGSMGNTGHSTGPHLHFAIFKNGKHENPLLYVRFR